MKNLKILLIGQPNVGKSSLLNALVGPKVVVSNYPGTTVEITQAEKVFEDVKINFVDTPGIYSISDRSGEEKLTEKALFEEKVDGAIIVADASSLERSLYLVLQILEAKIPVIIALNFIEEAERKGIKIDSEKLGKLLHIPTIPINPLTKRGIDKLVSSLLRIKKEEKWFMIKYDDHIEKAIQKTSLQIKTTSVQKRFISLRVLEGDEDFYRYLTDKKIIDKIKQNIKDHPKIAEDISITRYGTASLIAEKVINITSLRIIKREKRQEKMDNILLHKNWGPIITGFFFIATFGTLLYLGNLIQNVLMDLNEILLSSLGIKSHSLFTLMLTNSLTGVTAGVSIALPYVFLFYLILGLLEDIGVLSRFVVNAERFLKKIGLPGKAFLPLALGFGCTVPAARATRVLSSQKEKFYTASLFAFVPCSSRTAIILGIIGFYGGTKLAFFVFATSFAAGLIWAFGIKKVIKIKSEPLLLELPPYRRPLIKNVLAKSWIRMKTFVYIVIPLLAVGGMAIGLFDMLGLTRIILSPFSPITIWLGLPNVIIIPLIFGFFQKDLTGAMLLSVFGSEISSALTHLQIYTFGVATTIGIPCIIALGMLAKEFGFRRAILITATSISYGLFVAGLSWRLIRIL